MSAYKNVQATKQADAPILSSHSKVRRMRFFFHLESADEQIPDTSGVEVQDLETAHLEAMKAVRELLHEEGDDETDWTGWCLNIADGAGNILLSFQLGVLQAYSKMPEKRRLNG